MSTNVYTHMSRKVSIIVCAALAFALALVLSFSFSIPSFADEDGQPAAVTTQENTESSATGENTGNGEETTTTVVAESTVEAATTVNTQAPEQPAPNAAAATETETTTTSTATAAPSVQAQAQTETSQSASGASEEQATETISDEEVPLAASIAGSEPIPLKVINNDLHWFILLVIVIIGVIFLVRTGRMNRSIDKMRKFTK